ncbi:hypothetical protein QLL95_gp0327 [Cotonvirus japonicus]|uniref:Uncharacterized protein n=1 Tax=Cotonvirus japonicus TaxID=2811091 RepID=A0ABM7NRT9_9VIRU|nr:hypothetical protein QLL95_gp0327 [Cotonvirus japonicus]BCS82816.1 hypothetical protein [Cotonvirus japonicus]
MSQYVDPEAEPTFEEKFGFKLPEKKKRYNKNAHLDESHICKYSAPSEYLKLRGIDQYDCRIGHDGSRCNKCYILNIHGKCPYGHKKKKFNRSTKQIHFSDEPKVRFYGEKHEASRNRQKSYTECEKCGDRKTRGVCKRCDRCQKCGFLKIKKKIEERKIGYIQIVERSICINGCTDTDYMSGWLSNF